MKATGQLHQGLRGAMGDLIFRNYNGKTVVSLRPVYKNKTNTEARKKTRGKFREATMMAGNAMQDSKKKEYYQQSARKLKLPNAYTAAITDYLRRATVKISMLSGAKRKNIHKLMILVTKKGFEFNNIKVKAINNDGEILSEQGVIKNKKEKGFHLQIEATPNYDALVITTDELGKPVYTINREEILVM